MGEENENMKLVEMLQKVRSKEYVSGISKSSRPNLKIT